MSYHKSVRWLCESLSSVPLESRLLTLHWWATCLKDKGATCEYVHESLLRAKKKASCSGSQKPLTLIVRSQYAIDLVNLLESETVVKKGRRHTLRLVGRDGTLLDWAGV